MTKNITKSNHKVMKDLKTYCHEKSLRYTEPRQYVYDIITKSDKPIGAYEVLEHLRQYLPNPKPPTAYRAIDFLLEHGLVHRIESLNAYIACQNDHHHSGSQFMICDDCGDVSEAHACHLPEFFQHKAVESHFTPKFWNIEIHGQCDKCAHNT